MSNANTSLYGAAQYTYKLHPLVVFSILDHYKRRVDEQNRVVGTLLGELSGREIVIKNCFPIPHSEKEDQATVDLDYHNNMLELHRRVNPKEVVVGWYSTGNQISFVSALIHNTVYSDQVKPPINVPVLLTVDATLENWQMGIRAYVSHEVQAQTNNVLARFDPVKIELDAYEAEKIGVDALINGYPDPDDEKLDAPATILTDIENLEISLGNLLASIETVSEYVERVNSGEIEGDEQLGRAIIDALSMIPKLDTETFEKIFNDNVQDLLMIVYLSNLTRTQLELANKIQHLV